MSPGAHSPIEQDGLAADGVLFPGVWRATAAALKVCARAGLLVMVALLLFSDAPPTNPLAQMRMFAGLVLAPEIAAWCIARAFAARLRVERGLLRLDQRAQGTEIPVAAISGVAPWRLPLPGMGVNLRRVGDAGFNQGIMLANPAGFIETLRRQGGPASLADGLASRGTAYVRARLASPPGLLDRPLVKFVLFPLIPTLPAFRLHQYITYGGPFGEYQTYGLQAYLTAFTLWWISWAIGLVLFAAVLRTAVEVGTWVLLPASPPWLPRARRGLENLARVFYYIGVPLWLLLRLWPW